MSWMSAERFRNFIRRNPDYQGEEVIDMDDVSPQEDDAYEEARQELEGALDDLEGDEHLVD